MVREVFLDVGDWAVFDDVQPALARLRQFGWQYLIVSNHAPELEQLVHDLGLDNLVDDVLTSASSGYEKPHPEMFRAAPQRSGHPGQVWMVGDNPRADIDGARTAGIPALLVRTPDEHNHTADLAEAVEQILQHHTTAATHH